ncbi:MAG: hypothetical protein Kow0069_32590 [Promethearchaeota archaeon]
MEEPLTFYGPVLKFVEACHKCRACVHACPEKALEFGLSDVVVDYLKCAERHAKYGECIECAIGCHQGALGLVKFRLKDGAVERCPE